MALLLLGLPPWATAGPTVIHHELRVEMDPDRQVLEVQDTITFPGGAAAPADVISFDLHAGLAPQISKPAALALLGRVDGPVPIERYRLTLPAGQNGVTLNYRGRIHHPLNPASQGIGRTQHYTSGQIGGEGVFLDGNSYWYPRFGAEMVSFSMTVELPAGWEAVSQGERRTQADQAPTVWAETRPQDEIYLLAGRFHVYRQATPVAEAEVYLRQSDPALARRYLDATAEYLSLYSDLLGPYPYAKFALVENFWETGYGMPSFTLLGPRVIRLPFIIFTSYPHEILHNWWGNGVYVDYATGNWSEGLTSYLADHLMQERRGRGADYRRSALQKYADYVAEANDFPLNAFRGRHGEVSQAVGYNKTLMFFHMLRRRLGDELFLASLRRFYRDNSFAVAGFADLRRAFEQASAQNLKAEFEQWVERTGAPSLRVTDVAVVLKHGAFRLSGVLEQTQAAPAYHLDVPVAIQLEDRDTAFETRIRLNDKRQAFSIDLPGKPLRLMVDPRFDLFRRLDRREVPPSLGQLFGADELLFVLPADAPPDLRDAYLSVAKSWGGGASELAWDSERDRLPPDRTVWLMGWENRFRETLDRALDDQGVAVGEGGVTVAGQHLSAELHSVVLTARHPRNGNLTVAWVAGKDATAFPGLARKLPHYGKYSYLAFTGKSPTNVLKGQWPVQDSPLAVRLDESAVPPLKLAPRPPLNPIRLPE